MGGQKTFFEPHRARTRSETTCVLLYYIYMKTICVYLIFIIWKSRKQYTLSLHWCWPGYVHMSDIMSTPQPLFSSYQLPHSLGGMKVTSPHMRPVITVSRSTWNDKNQCNGVATNLFCLGVIGHQKCSSFYKN